MTTYMLRYNRTTGKLDDLQEFPNVPAALAAMTEEELKDLRFGDGIEYHISQAESLDDLKAKQPRFFNAV